jgi:type III secretion protein T
VAAWLLFGPVGILAVVAVILFSFELWPVASSGPYGQALGYQTAIVSSNQLVRAILMLAAPPIVALVLVEFCLALIGRFAQQLDVNVAAMPLKTLIAAASAALILSYFLDWVREERSWSDRALHFMREATTTPERR